MKGAKGHPGMRGAGGQAQAVKLKNPLTPHVGYAHGGHPTGAAGNDAAAKGALRKAASKGGRLASVRG